MTLSVNLSEKIVVPTIDISKILDIDIEYLNYLGLGKEFIFAGETIHNILTKSKLVHIDLWIFVENAFIKLLEYLCIFKPINFNIYSSYIEIEFKNYEYKIRLINVLGSDVEKLINMFDVDCYQCYYDGFEIYTFPLREKCIETKFLTIPSERCIIQDENTVYNNNKKKLFDYTRINNLVSQGYNFSYDFYTYYNICDKICNIDNNKEKCILSVTDLDILTLFVKREVINNKIITLNKEEQVHIILPLIYKNIITNMVNFYVKPHVLSINSIVTCLYNTLQTKQVYRNFVISDESYKSIVDEFYKNNLSQYNNNNITNNIDDIPIEELTNILDTYIDNKYLSSKCIKDKSDDKYLNSYIEIIKNTYIKTIKYYLYKIDQSNKKCLKETSQSINNKFCEVILKYESILNNPIFEVEKFYKTLLIKYLTIASHDGCIFSWLVFANFCPTMINNNYYPYINNTTHVHYYSKKNIIEYISNASINNKIKSLFEKYSDLIFINKNKNIEYNFENCKDIYTNKFLENEKYYDSNHLVDFVTPDDIYGEEEEDRYNNEDDYRDYLSFDNYW